MSLDVEAIRKEFPILESLAHGKPLVYLDSANTSQKPTSVLDRTAYFNVAENANDHRGVYKLY
jgi:cysteine desulfurase / selenocysteine lyase